MVIENLCLKVKTNKENILHNNIEATSKVQILN